MFETPRGWFDVNYATQNNGDVQVLATLCIGLQLLCDLPETSTERFVEPDLWSFKMSLPLALHCTKT